MGLPMIVVSRMAVALSALALAAGAPLAARSAPAKANALKAGSAKCTVNDDKAASCKIRKSESGGLDIETTGEDPLLAMVVDDGLNLFALVGDDSSRVPLIMDYARDTADPGCWRAVDSDAVVWRLCVRQGATP